jgi:ketosteroid isomerase-like protein
MKTEEELIQFEKQWNSALENNNADEISKFMSPDWIIVGSDGITGKSSFLESVRTGILTHNRMDSDEMTAKIHGNTGIIISRGTSAGIYDGQAFELYEWSCSTYIKEEQQWYCVSTMVTKANRL